MADQSQIRQLQTPDNQINVFPITLEKCISDNSGMVLSQKMATLQSDIATVEPSSTSAHAYAVGDYLMYSSQLYRVTQVIAVGDTLIVGTNIEATKIVENLSGVVTGVKGAAESSYRTGDVNLTLDNLGYESVNNLNTTESGKLLDARQGKVLNDEIQPIKSRVSQFDFLSIVNGKLCVTYTKEV